MEKVIVESVVATKDEVAELENAFYATQAMQELINSGVSQSLVLDKHIEVYTKYNKLWSNLLKKYFKTDYSTKADHEWSCDFISCTITITAPANVVVPKA